MPKSSAQYLVKISVLMSSANISIFGFMHHFSAAVPLYFNKTVLDRIKNFGAL